MHTKQKKFTWKYNNIHLLQCFVWKCVDYATFGKTTLTITRIYKNWKNMSIQSAQIKI